MDCRPGGQGGAAGGATSRKQGVRRFGRGRRRVQCAAAQCHVSGSSRRPESGSRGGQQRGVSCGRAAGLRGRCREEAAAHLRDPVLHAVLVLLRRQRVVPVDAHAGGRKGPHLRGTHTHACEGRRRAGGGRGWRMAHCRRRQHGAWGMQQQTTQRHQTSTAWPAACAAAAHPPTRPPTFGSLRSQLPAPQRLPHSLSTSSTAILQSASSASWDSSKVTAGRQAQQAQQAGRYSR